MNFQEFHQLCLEAQHAMDFLVNPKNKDKTMQEVLDEFEASGGESLGSGSFGDVFAHPNWNYVIKIFTDDDCYLRFIRYISKNPNKIFPRVVGSVQRVVPFYKRS